MRNNNMKGDTFFNKFKNIYVNESEMRKLQKIMINNNLLYNINYKYARIHFAKYFDCFATIYLYKELNVKGVKKVPRFK